MGPMMRRRIERDCGGGEFKPAFRGIRGGGSGSRGEGNPPLRNRRLIGRFEAARSGSWSG
jgi:hypothetical protein